MSDEFPVRSLGPAPRLQGPRTQNNPSGMADFVYRLTDLQRQINDLSGSILKSAGVRALPGKIASTDWDGSDHDNLGTAGWVLGRDGEGPSYLALNGADLFEYLLSQTTEDERDPGTLRTYTASSNADTGTLWWPVDAGDASVTVTTSSTGRLRVDVTGQLDAQATGYGEATAAIGFEVLAGATQVLAPLDRHGAYVTAHGGGFAAGATTGPGDATWVTQYASGVDLVTLQPNTAYTVRTRRGYRTRSVAAAPGSAWNIAVVSAGTTRLAVTKLGM